MSIKKVLKFIYDNNFIILFVVLFVVPLIFVCIEGTYYLGWMPIFKLDYFTLPNFTLNFMIDEYHGRYYNVSGLGYFLGSIGFLFLLYLSFNWEIATDFINGALRYKLIPKILLIYVTPLVLIWFYPVLIDLFNQDSKLSLFVHTKLRYKIFAILFILGLVYTFYVIVKYRIKLNIKKLKDDIRKDVLNEIKNNSSIDFY